MKTPGSCNTGALCAHCEMTSWPAPGTTPGLRDAGNETMTFGQVESLATSSPHVLLALGARPGTPGVVVGDRAGRVGSLRLEPYRHAFVPSTRLFGRRGHRRPRLPAAPFLIVDPATRRGPNSSSATTTSVSSRWEPSLLPGVTQRTGCRASAPPPMWRSPRNRDLHHLFDQWEHGSPEGGDGLPTRHVAATTPARRPTRHRGCRGGHQFPCSTWRLDFSMMACRPGTPPTWCAVPTRSLLTASHAGHLRRSTAFRPSGAGCSTSARPWTRAAGVALTGTSQVTPELLEGIKR